MKPGNVCEESKVAWLKFWTRAASCLLIYIRNVFLVKQTITGSAVSLIWHTEVQCWWILSCVAVNVALHVSVSAWAQLSIKRTWCLAYRQVLKTTYFRLILHLPVYRFYYHQFYCLFTKVTEATNVVTVTLISGGSRGGSLGSDKPPLLADPGVVAENARTGVTKRHFTVAVHSLIWHQHEYIEG